MELNNKTAVITGGGTGIGRATALKLAKEGCRLALISRKTAELLKTKKEIENLFKTPVIIFPCDVTQETEVLKVFMEIGKEFGTIDFLVNGAGTNTQKGFEVITEEEIDREINVKTKGILFCTRAALAFMKKGGAVVNLSSITARTGSANSSPGYAAGNALAANLTKSLALQLAKYSIRVNAVAPGFTYPTGLTKDYSKEKLAKMAEASPLKRLCAPEDVANGIYFLLSPLSAFVNGHTLDINGGFWMN